MYSPLIFGRQLHIVAEKLCQIIVGLLNTHYLMTFKQYGRRLAEYILCGNSALIVIELSNERCLVVVVPFLYLAQQTVKSSIGYRCLKEQRQP